MNPKAKIKMLGQELEVELTSDQIMSIYNQWKHEVESKTDCTENEWQLCPKCMGEMMVNAPCDVCGGEKILSTLNGQPPSKQ